MSTFNPDEVMTDLDWDSEISQDSEFVLLPEGEYDFVVKKFERGIHNGSEKLPRCNKAILTIEVSSSDGKKATIEHNLFIHRKCEGMLCEFFTAIGHRKHGESMKMNWSLVPGATGRCKIFVDTWENKKTGEPMQSNKIKKFLEPKTPPMSTGFTPGQF